MPTGPNEMTQDRFCASCGAERRGEAKFCPKCGSRFDESPQQTAESPAPKEEPAAPNSDVGAPSVIAATVPAYVPASAPEPSAPTVIEETQTPPQPPPQPVAEGMQTPPQPSPPQVSAAPATSNPYWLPAIGALVGVFVGGVYWWVAFLYGAVPGLRFFFRNPVTHLVLLAIITGVIVGLWVVIFAGRRTFSVQIVAAGAAILSLLVGRILLGLGQGVPAGLVFARGGLGLTMFMDFVIASATAAVAASPLLGGFSISRSGGTA